MSDSKDSVAVKRTFGGQSIFFGGGWTREDEALPASQRQGRVIERLQIDIDDLMKTNQATVEKNSELVNANNLLHEKLDDANAELLTYRLVKESVRELACGACGKSRIARSHAAIHVCDCEELKRKLCER